jgi:dynein light chain roadblock-type
MEGTPIKTTLNTEQTYFYTTSAAIFIKRCKNIVSELVKNEELAFIRIRTKQNEIMIAPDNEFVLVVIQNPSANN